MEELSIYTSIQTYLILCLFQQNIEYFWQPKFRTFRWDITEA